LKYDAELVCLRVRDGGRRFCNDTFRDARVNMKIVTPDKFGQLMDDFAATVQQDYSRATRAVALEWFSGVIRRTPVDTGRMRGNWLTTSGTPNYSVTDRTDEGAAISEARNNIDPLGITYMTNNLPYAERREAEGGAPVTGSQRDPFQYGQGVGGGFIDEELARVVQNMEAIIANAA
jgi:hypothetical protein